MSPEPAFQPSAEAASTRIFTWLLLGVGDLVVSDQPVGPLEAHRLNLARVVADRRPHVGSRSSKSGPKSFALSVTNRSSPSVPAYSSEYRPGACNAVGGEGDRVAGRWGDGRRRRIRRWRRRGIRRRRGCRASARERERARLGAGAGSELGAGAGAGGGVGPVGDFWSPHAIVTTRRAIGTTRAVIFFMARVLVLLLDWPGRGIATPPMSVLRSIGWAQSGRKTAHALERAVYRQFRETFIFWSATAEGRSTGRAWASR